MIKSKWIKTPDKTDFSPYEDILLDEYDLNQIRKIPANVMNKLFLITEAELSKKLLEWDIDIELVRWAILYSKYLKEYFKI